MKKYLVILLVGATAFSCTNKEMEQKVVQLTEENQQLLTEAQEKDASVAQFMESFNDIEKNLAEIRERELNIAINNEDDKLREKDVKERIADDIKAINDLMAQNKETVEKLNKQLRGAWGAHSKVKKAMETLQAEMTAQIEEKDTQIATLKTDLEGLNFTVAELNATVDTLSAKASEQTAVIEDKVNTINTAYYTVGTKKDLIAENVVTKEGGFLGIGKTEKVAQAFDKDQFNQIDITEVKTFVINAKKAELVSTHPTDSYTFEKKEDQQIESLVVLDPEKFWSSSKYLVVMAD